MKWKIIVCMGAMKKKLMKKTMRITQLVVGQTDSSAAPQCLMVSHIKISLNNVSVLCCAVTSAATATASNQNSFYRLFFVFPFCSHCLATTSSSSPSWSWSWSWSHQFGPVGTEFSPSHISSWGSKWEITTKTTATTESWQIPPAPLSHNTKTQLWTEMLIFLQFYLTLRSFIYYYGIFFRNNIIHLNRFPRSV